MTNRRMVIGGVAGVLVAVTSVVAMVIQTAPVRGVVRAYTEIAGAAHAGDLEHVRSLCSSRYLRTHRLEEAAEEGVKGVPRNLNKNFKAWREGEAVWLCPTSRMGPIYQFVKEGGSWKFDGPIGLMDAHGRVERMAEGAEVEYE